MNVHSNAIDGRVNRRLITGVILAAGAAALFVMLSFRSIRARPAGPVEREQAADRPNGRVEVAGRPGPAARHAPLYQPRLWVDTGGFRSVLDHVRWNGDASLTDIAKVWDRAGYRIIDQIDKHLSDPKKSVIDRLRLSLSKAAFFNFEAEPNRAYEVLEQARAWVEKTERPAEISLYTIIFYQGVTALRRGETDNCIMCRGESSCILPIVPAAVHTDATGSRLAIRHFTEYLDKFPDDLEVRWLLNLAHMTLGEHPTKVDPRFLVNIDHFLKSEFDIGRFRDIGQKVGVNRFNMAGGAVMEDFDNDGLLDLAVTTFDPTVHMAYYRNMGDGTFKDRSEQAGLLDQLGGKYLVQTDFNNDGRLDLFISRGAWFTHPMPQSLLRNDGDGTFTDVTRQAGFHEPFDSTSSCWADYDNDGWLDAHIVCEGQNNRLYHNRGDGTFEEVGSKAGIGGNVVGLCKGANWIDFDNDDYPDLFVDFLQGDARLLHNNRNGTFSDVTSSMGIDGPRYGFSCWAWDYDNDGWLDIFASCFDFSVQDTIKGMMGQPHKRLSNRLWRNVDGKRFENMTRQAGLDLVFGAMGCNYGDFDNDGFLDFYLGTGDPELSSLVPNRMFKNMAGERFAEITASAGTGNLQKGHGVSCADWDRDGDVDVFIEMGGALKGDQYHNILFQNPGQGNHWLTVKLVGKKTNRAAIGARIKVVTAGEHPLTVHRHVSSGSSWGANPLQQHIGLAKADRVALLEIHWPTSGTTQVFHDIAANQAILVTEFAQDYQKLDWKPVPAPR